MEEVKIRVRASIIEEKIRDHNKEFNLNAIKIFTSIQGFEDILDNDKISYNNIERGMFANGINQYLNLGNINKARGYVECFEELVKLLE